MKGKKGAIAVLLALVALSLFTKNCSASRAMIDLPSLIRGGPVVSGGGAGDFCGSKDPCKSPFKCMCVPIYPVGDICTCQNLVNKMQETPASEDDLY